MREHKKKKVSKEFKYSTVAYCVQLLLYFLLIGFVLYRFVFMDHQPNFSRGIGVAILLLAASPALYSIRKKKLLISDKLWFYSFYYDIKPTKEKGLFPVEYSSITSLELRRFFLPWMKMLRVTVRGRERPVLVEPFMNHHKELYQTIVEAVRENNPEAYIASEIEHYTKK
ncbi:MAG: hypothetical protein IKD72_00975 [Clostridia bacterium]|nr:hypothetical protein [Clostridia bacterium]